MELGLTKELVVTSVFSVISKTGVLGPIVLV